MHFLIESKIYKPGYSTKILTAQDFTNSVCTVGMNILLVEESAADRLVYRETFDTRVDGAICGAWTPMVLKYGDIEGPILVEPPL